MSATDSAEILRPWRDASEIPLDDLADRLSVGRGVRQQAVRQGLITPVGRRGPGGGYVVSPADAERFTKAVLIAGALAIGVIVALRILSGPGVSAGGGTLTIPVPGITT